MLDWLETRDSLVLKAFVSILAGTFFHPKAKMAEASGPTSKHPAFLTHDWGVDRSNHKRVVRVAKNLQQRGLPVWIDETEMAGHIMQKISDGIESSDVIVVFITRCYLDKVGGSDVSDNCKLEFNYASRKSKPMIPVVMEEQVRDNHAWNGPVGIFLGGHLYVKMWDDEDIDGEGLERLIEQIIKRTPAWSGLVTQAPTTPTLAEPVQW